MCNTGDLGAAVPEGEWGQGPGHNREAGVNADVLWLIRHIMGWSAGSGCSHEVPGLPQGWKKKWWWKKS